MTNRSTGLSTHKCPGVENAVPAAKAETDHFHTRKDSRVPNSDRSSATGLVKLFEKADAAVLLMSEEQIQKAIIDNLRDLAVGGYNRIGGVIVMHPANGGIHQSTKGQRIKHAELGVLSGAPDLLLFFNGNKYAWEVKALKGKLGVNQQAIGTLLRSEGFITALTFGWPDAQAQLYRWGMLKGRAQ